MWVLSLWTSLFGILAATQQVSFSGSQPSTEIKSTNLTDLVQWGGYSLFVQGQRITLWSGEMHPWHILTPQLYLDVMQRIKALGFNAISMYTFWGTHNPAPGVLEFDDWKSLDPFFESANEAGLWVIARPGPYINAEVAGGGIPGWVTALNVSLRTSDPVFREAYEPYWRAVGEIFARHQITENGPIIGVQIDNEYFLDDEGSLDLEYIENLEKSMREFGIVVPLTFNDVALEYRLVEGRGAVDIYGVDSYPQNTDCSDPSPWKDVQTSFRQVSYLSTAEIRCLTLLYFQNTSGKVGSPFYIPEFQGGWIPGIDTKGFAQCQALFDSDFQRVFYHSNIAQGTNFGHTAFPGGITTYDYWEAIAEDRTLKQKYRDLKSMSHFVRSSRDLAKTWIVGKDSGAYTDAPPGVVRVDELRNPDTDAGFYIVRHENSSSTEETTFDITLTNRDGDVSIPMTLNGRDSRVLTTNHCWGDSCVAYSSASILTTMATPELDVLIVHGTPDQSWQVAFPHSNATFEQLSGFSRLEATQTSNRTIVTFNISSGDHSMIKVEGGEKLMTFHVLDTSVADYVWEAVLPSEGPFGAHYGIGSNNTVTVFGPYFLRSARLDDNGTTVHLDGDLSGTTQIYIAAAMSVRNFTWNGATISPVQGANLLWSIVLPGPQVPAVAPILTGWKWADSLPELSETFDDNQWATANRVTTSNPNQPYPGYNGKYVLYMQDYGHAVGNTILRGHFRGNGAETGFELNGRYLGSALVDKNEGIENVNTTVAFPEGSVNKGHNVLLIVLDNAALEENNKFTAFSSDIQSPRGLRGYTLTGGDFSGYEMHWKVQGNLGGWTDFPDRVRSIFNTGGLAGEREGWHLPGFDDSDWQEGFDALTAPGVRFYRANLAVDYPNNTDIHYRQVLFVFPNSTGSYRAQLFVNGWQYGRRYGDYGPQTVFPVPPGILIQGDNTIALSIFAMAETTESFSLGGELSLRIDPAVTTSTLDLAGMRVPSPYWDEIYGVRVG